MRVVGELAWYGMTVGGVGVLCLVWLAGGRLQQQASKQQAQLLVRERAFGVCPSGEGEGGASASASACHPEIVETCLRHDGYPSLSHAQQ